MTLLSVLAEPEGNREWFEGGIVRPNDDKTRHIIACMAVDETEREGAYGLKRWYEGFGFEKIGHLKHVGRRFDRW